MIISDEQALLAFRLLREGALATGSGHEAVSDELFSQAVAAAVAAPDTRPERVAEARARCAQGPLDSQDIANKMISRIVSDSLR